jgi:hypothetical protein
MNDVYEINVAKARLRDAYNAGNVDLLLMAFADEFTDMSSGKPSFFGADAKSVFRMRMTNLFEQHQATLIVTIIAIRVFAGAAFDYGWHSLTLTPREVASRQPPERDTSRLGRKPPAESGRSISTLTTWTWPP